MTRETDSQPEGEKSPVFTNDRRLRIAWWNTRLSPPIASTKAALKGEDREIAFETISWLLSIFDIVALGEVSTQDIADLEQFTRSNRLEFLDLTRTSTRHRFNIAVIYDRERCVLARKELLTDSVGLDTHKIGAHTRFLIDDELILDLFTVHWTSRITKQEETPDRTHFGTSLKRKVDAAKEESFGHAIVLGDFNDEPFNTSMTKYLGATRDAHFAKKKPTLLYNPFWKSLSCRIGYGRAGEVPEPTGTYYLGGDSIHRWRVFDQMFFSNAFIGQSDWHLIEEETGVLRTSKLMEALQDRGCKLDHLPIYCTISKEG